MSAPSFRVHGQASSGAGRRLARAPTDVLPSLVAREVIATVRSQLHARFPSTTQGFLRDDALDEGHAAIDDLLARPNAVFRGLCLSFGLPFLQSRRSGAPRCVC